MRKFTHGRPLYTKSINCFRFWNGGRESVKPDAPPQIFRRAHKMCKEAMKPEPKFRKGQLVEKQSNRITTQKRLHFANSSFTYLTDVVYATRSSSMSPSRSASATMTAVFKQFSIHRIRRFHTAPANQYKKSQPGFIIQLSLPPSPRLASPPPITRRSLCHHNESHHVEPTFKPTLVSATNQFLQGFNSETKKLNYIANLPMTP